MEARRIVVVRPGRPDSECQTTLEWRPRGMEEPLLIDVERFFGEALEGE